MSGTASGPAARCRICPGVGEGDLRPVVRVCPAVARLIREDTGSWDEGGWICPAGLQRFRDGHVRQLLRDEKGEITTLESEVLASLREHGILSRNPGAGFDSRQTLGQRMADRTADFGGSWPFILTLAGVVVVWTALLVGGVAPEYTALRAPCQTGRQER